MLMDKLDNKLDNNLVNKPVFLRFCLMNEGVVVRDNPALSSLGIKWQHLHVCIYLHTMFK